MKKYTEKQKLLHSIKKEFIEYMSVDPIEDRYYIRISAENWHKIFKTAELNKCGITYDKDYR